MSDFRKDQADHWRIREMLSVYIDGELPSEDRVRVQEHLTGCADCTWELETLRQTVDLVVQLPKVPVPHAFTIHEAQLPKRVGLFQARWAYTYLKGATALAAALLILVLAGDALFQFGRATTGLAPAMAPAKEFGVPAAAPTVVAMQKAPAAPTEAPSLTQRGDETEEGVYYAEITPSPLPAEEKQVVTGEQYGAAEQVAPVPPPSEETKVFTPTPTASADRGGGEPVGREDAAATSLATPAPQVVGKAGATDTPLPSAEMEAPVEEAQVPMAPAAAPMVASQPQMTATPILAAPLPVSAATDTPTPLLAPIAMATATPAPTATPLSMAKAPAEVHPTEETALAGWRARPQEPRLMPLRVVEASLCLLVIILIVATLIVRQTQRNLR